jgi:hypothetical protein
MQILRVAILNGRCEMLARTASAARWVGHIKIAYFLPTFSTPVSSDPCQAHYLFYLRIKLSTGWGIAC